MSNRVSCVLNTIRHQPGVRIPRGELVVERQFAETFIAKKRNHSSVKTLSDADLLSECGHALKLDLVCIQSKEIQNSASDGSIKLKDISRFSNEDFFVFWIVDGVFQRLADQMGMMKLLREVVRLRDDIHAELEHISERVVATLAKGVAAGAHGIIIADDIAYQHRTYMSPEFVEQYLLPFWKTQVGAAEDLGVPVFFHSDGNLNAVLPLIVEAGFDGLQCIEPSAGMDIHAIKRKYGSDLCLMGNIDPSLLIGKSGQNGTDIHPDQLRSTVFDLAATAGDGGGFIFGTCSGLYSGMSNELVYKMYHFLNEAVQSGGS